MKFLTEHRPIYALISIALMIVSLEVFAMIKGMDGQVYTTSIGGVCVIAGLICGKKLWK